jgi:hypothetical protein
MGPTKVAIENFFFLNVGCTLQIINKKKSKYTYNFQHSPYKDKGISLLPPPPPAPYRYYGLGIKGGLETR